MKEKIKNRHNRSLDVAMGNFIKDFSLFVKRSHRSIVWSVEKIQMVKIQKFQGQKTEE